MRTENNVIVEDPTIYPNPVRDRMNIDFGTNEGSATVLVYDMSGTLMIEKHYDLSQSRTVELTDMNAVPDGVYLVTLDINNVRNQEDHQDELIQNLSSYSDTSQGRYLFMDTDQILKECTFTFSRSGGKVVSTSIRFLPGLRYGGIWKRLQPYRKKKGSC